MSRPLTKKLKAGPGYRISEWLQKNMDSRLQMTQTELAEKLGYGHQGMISMMKLGRTKVPLDKVELLAKELDADPAFVMKMALEQYLPGEEEIINRVFARMVTDNQYYFVQQVEDAIPAGKTNLTAKQKKLIRLVLQSTELADRIDEAYDILGRKSKADGKADGGRVKAGA